MSALCQKQTSAPPIGDGLGAGTRDEAANLSVAVTVVIGPHHGRSETVRLSHNGVVWHHKPFSVNPDTITAILCVPIDILHADAVGKRTAQALSARETVEPRLERRISKSAVVTRNRLAWHQATRKRYQTNESVHRGLHRSVRRVR